MHDAVGANEHHVERDVGVLHPHCHLARLVVGEQHAGLFGQVRAEHQPALHLVDGLGGLDIDDHRAVPRDEGQRFPSHGIGRLDEC